MPLLYIRCDFHKCSSVFVLTPTPSKDPTRNVLQSWIAILWPIETWRHNVGFEVLTALLMTITVCCLLLEIVPTLELEEKAPATRRHTLEDWNISDVRISCHRRNLGGGGNIFFCPKIVFFWLLSWGGVKKKLVWMGERGLCILRTGSNRHSSLTA